MSLDLPEDAPEEWAKAVKMFYDLIREELGNNFVEMIALSTPDPEVYSSNVLVVVKRVAPSLAQRITEVLRKVHEELGKDYLIMPTMAPEFATEVINQFRVHVKGEKVIPVTVEDEEEKREEGEDLLGFMRVQESGADADRNKEDDENEKKKEVKGENSIKSSQE